MQLTAVNAKAIDDKLHIAETTTWPICKMLLC